MTVRDSEGTAQNKPQTLKKEFWIGTVDMMYGIGSESPLLFVWRLRVLASPVAGFWQFPSCSILSSAEARLPYCSYIGGDSFINQCYGQFLCRPVIF